MATGEGIRELGEESGQLLLSELRVRCFELILLEPESLVDKLREAVVLESRCFVPAEQLKQIASVVAAETNDLEEGVLAQTAMVVVNLSPTGRVFVIELCLLRFLMIKRRFLQPFFEF